MYKAFFNTLILSVLMLFNLVLITWFIDYLGHNETTTQPPPLTPIDSTTVGTPAIPKPPRVPDGSLAIPNAVAAPTETPTSVLPQGPTQQRIVLEFASEKAHLNSDQQQRFEQLLVELRLLPLHRVKIIAGPIDLNSRSFSPQMSKLRAQAIGRTIYAHTQALTMLYDPSLPSGTVVVEISLAPH